MKKVYAEPDAEWIRYPDCDVITDSSEVGPGEIMDDDDPWGKF